MEEKELFKLSVSKAKSFEQCPALYKYAYIDHFPRKEFSFHTLGKFLHQLLEDFHNVQIGKKLEHLSEDLYSLQETSLLNKLYRQCLQHKDYLNKMSAQDLIEAKEIVKSYLSFHSNWKTTNSKIISLEYDFKIGIRDTLLLNGAIDRLEQESDGIYHVLDYKTTKNKKYLKDDFTQLLTYAYVVYKSMPNVKKVKTSYILLRHDCQLFSKEFSEDEILSVEDKFLDYYNKIMSEKLFRPIPTRLCEYCSYADICPDGQKMIRAPSTEHGKVSW